MCCHPLNVDPEISMFCNGSEHSRFFVTISPCVDLSQLEPYQSIKGSSWAAWFLERFQKIQQILFVLCAEFAVVFHDNGRFACMAVHCILNRDFTAIMDE